MSLTDMLTRCNPDLSRRRVIRLVSGTVLCSWASLLSFAEPNANPVPENTTAPTNTTPADTTTTTIAAATNEPEGEKPARVLLRGQVVPMADALKKRGLKAYPEELAHQFAVVTEGGDIWPILPDWRGRAFYQDERLRQRPVELIGFRREGVPYFQVLTIYTFDAQQQRQYTDYWCDICSIPMYEIKPCDCCQQDIRLRFQPQALPAEFRSPAADR